MSRVPSPNPLHICPSTHHPPFPLPSFPHSSSFLHSILFSPNSHVPCTMWSLSSTTVTSLAGQARWTPGCKFAAVQTTFPGVSYRTIFGKSHFLFLASYSLHCLLRVGTVLPGAHGSPVKVILTSGSPCQTEVWVWKRRALYTEICGYPFLIFWNLLNECLFPG